MPWKKSNSTEAISAATLVRSNHESICPMTTRLICCLLAWSSVWSVFAQQPPGTSSTPISAVPAGGATPKPLRELVNQLDQSGLQEVIDQLRSNYVDPSALTNQEINQAAVEGLLSRLGPGATIQTKTQAEQPTRIFPFKSDLIERQFGYVRLGTFTQQNLAQLDDVLHDLVAKGATGLILDLRTMPPGSDFQLAADILSRFVPKGKVLFKLVQQKEGRERLYTSTADPIFTGAIAVLVSPENAGTAEAIAGSLRSEVHALIFGQKTSGRAVEYERFLVGEGLVLTVAVGKLVIPGTATIFPDGLTPDISVAFQKQQQAAVLGLEDENGIRDYIFDEERPHTNEAALVAGKNPDLDTYEANSMNRNNKPRAPKDAVLQRAIDFLTTISIFRVK
jgi:Peptidase family S41